jgi:phage/plasmid-like protein (TIGR03299 family)
MKERMMTDTDTVTTVITQPRELPWARVNRLVDEDGERLELDTTDDVLEATGLDFTVSKRPMRRQALDGTWLESKRVSVVRDDTEEEVDVVSQDYGVFQYTEAFEFLNHIPGREFVAAGPLKDSRQAFMVVRLPDLDDFEVAGTDLHELNVVIRTSHDRSRAVEVFTMPLRVLCTNQLPIRPLGQGVTNRWAVNHIGNVTEKMHDAEQLVARVRDYVSDFRITAERLVGVNLGTDEASTVLRRVIRDAPKKDETIETILSLWANADTVGFHGTGWGLVNAVSEHYEHGRRGGTDQSRLLGALEGQTRSLMDRTVPFILGRFGK